MARDGPAAISACCSWVGPKRGWSTRRWARRSACVRVLERQLSHRCLRTASLWPTGLIWPRCRKLPTGFHWTRRRVRPLQAGHPKAWLRAFGPAGKDRWLRRTNTKRVVVWCSSPLRPDLALHPAPVQPGPRQVRADPGAPVDLGYAACRLTLTSPSQAGGPSWRWTTARSSYPAFLTIRWYCFRNSPPTHSGRLKAAKCRFKAPISSSATPMHRARPR